MRTRTLSAILLWLALSLILPSGTPAAVVGRITQVEGKVDLLKKGQLPATPVKHNDGVEPGDVVRTKSLSKAQITFVDQTILTISPGSRITIEKYMVDGGKRNAVLQMFQGVALAVVSKFFKSEGPDFVVKTNTAIMGIRGTEVGIRLFPNFSEFLNFEGRTSVRNRFPEIRGEVELSDGQGTRVARGLPPTFAFRVGTQDREQFMQQLATGLNARVRGKDSNPATSGSQELARSSSGSDQLLLVSIPPRLNPQEQQEPEKPTEEVVTKETPPPPSESQSLLYEYNGQYQMSFNEGHKLATFSGLITFSTANVQAEFVIEAADPSSPGNFAKNSSGNIHWTLSGDLTREQGSTGAYTGILWATGTTDGGTIFKFPLAASYLDGKLSLNSIGPVAGDYNSTPIWGFDFTSPGESHKITQGSATISWNLGAIPTPTPAPTPSATPQKVEWNCVGSYAMKFEEGHHNAIFTGSLNLKNSQVNYTVVAEDPASPGNFQKGSAGTITWNVTGVLNPSGDDSYRGLVVATGTTNGGTVFTFTLEATYKDGKLTLNPTSQGTYASSADGSNSQDFTSPGASHKITQGLATINWTSTPTAAVTSTSMTTAEPASSPIPATATATAGPAASAPTLTSNSTTTITPTGSSVSALSPVSSMPATVVSSGITTLPPTTTLTAAGPPGQAVSAAAPGQAVSAAAPGQAAAALTPMASSGMTPSGVTPPGLQNLPAAFNGPPGQSNAPGQTGNGPPGHAYGHSK
jgi:hypothetical protein